MRSRIVINISHAHGLCISYERIVRVTLGLSDITLNIFEYEEEVTSGNLHTSLFTIRTKGNTDKNLLMYNFEFTMPWN